MNGLINVLKSIPERHRWKVYIGLLGIFVLLFAALLIVDLWRGGDAGEWIKWTAGALGVGGFGLAAANSDRHGS